MLEVQFQQILDDRLIFIRQLGLIPLGTSSLLEHLASLTLCYSQLSAGLFDNFSTPGRD